MQRKGRRPQTQLHPETQYKCVLTGPSPFLHSLPKVITLSSPWLENHHYLVTTAASAHPPSQVPTGITRWSLLNQVSPRFIQQWSGWVETVPGTSLSLQLSAPALAQSPLPLKSQCALQPFLPSDTHASDDRIGEHFVKEVCHELSR